MKKIYIVEDKCCFPKKHFTEQEVLDYFKELDKKAEWKNWISDEEYERRFHKKKFGNYKILGTKFVRFKLEYETPDYYGEVWSDEPYSVPYFTDKKGKFAMEVWVTNIEAYDDFWEFSCYQDDKHEEEKKNEIR